MLLSVSRFADAVAPIEAGHGVVGHFQIHAAEDAAAADGDFEIGDGEHLVGGLSAR